MSLVWGSITITDWFHEMQHKPEGWVLKDCSFANSSGSTFINLGKGLDHNSSKIIFFQSEGNRLNAFYEDSAAAIDAKIALMTAVTIPQTLTYNGKTHTNMMMIPGSLNLQSDARKIISGGAVKYIQFFSITFREYKA